MPRNAETRLAQHAATLAFEHLPASAVECAKIFITDTLSVGVAGSRVPEVQPLMQALGQSGREAMVGLWGTRATSRSSSSHSVERPSGALPRV